MHTLTGHRRNTDGTLVTSRLTIERTSDGRFVDAETGESYEAREYKVTDDVVSIEIINSPADLTAFEPARGECERIGMPVARLK